MKNVKGKAKKDLLRSLSIRHHISTLEYCFLNPLKWPIIDDYEFQYLRIMRKDFSRCNNNLNSNNKLGLNPSC